MIGHVRRYEAVDSVILAKAGYPGVRSQIGLSWVDLVFCATVAGILQKTF